MVYIKNLARIVICMLIMAVFCALVVQSVMDQKEEGDKIVNKEQNNKTVVNQTSSNPNISTILSNN